jgi:hypothetical protein
MYLLFGNNRIEDIIDGIRLEEYALLSRGMLTINFILSEPPEKWMGLEGMITPSILKNWFKVTTPTSSTSQHFSDKADYGLRRYNIPRPPTIIDDINSSQPSSSSPSYPKIIDDSILVDEILPIRSTPVAQMTQHHPLKHKNDESGKISISIPNKKFQSKIIVCGPTDMMMTVEQTLIEMGYSQQDYILLI